MTYGTNPPTITKLAFECPHCGAYTSQHWYRLFAGNVQTTDAYPYFPGPEHRKRVLANKEISSEIRDQLVIWLDNIDNRQPFLERHDDGTSLRAEVGNLHLSECFVCKKLSVWVHDAVIFPQQRTGPNPNSDMPPEIARDFEEARSILGQSARGAAALLRLCVQKLCDHLGETGKTIDAAIESLVSKGLNPVIQQALDSVRVIGNEAVHPGTIDLRDDTETAGKLFGLVNVIVERMITQPKQVDEIYKGLPESKRNAIDARNTRALKDKN